MRVDDEDALRADLDQRVARRAGEQIHLTVNLDDVYRGRSLLRVNSGDGSEQQRAGNASDAHEPPSDLPPKREKHAAFYTRRMADAIELGLDTFGDVTLDTNGQPHSHAHTMRDVVTQAVLADQVGLKFFGVGEHHRKDFAVSAPEVVLAAIAAQTSRIHLGSAVTVLNSDDPIRVFQRFSTLNALSNGRAEVIVGRGSFTESFPLFGFDMRNTKRCSRRSSTCSSRCWPASR